jgi:hypothetical protein
VALYDAASNICRSLNPGFKLLGGRDSARMFDVADNPISALMIGVLATVLVQSSSTTTSIIISLVGASELSVKMAVYMVGWCKLKHLNWCSAFKFAFYPPSSSCSFPLLPPHFSSFLLLPPVDVDAC